MFPTHRRNILKTIIDLIESSISLFLFSNLPKTKYNFVGKLLGPKGNSLKWLQEQTQTKMAILGRGSMRNKDKVRATLPQLTPPATCQIPTPTLCTSDTVICDAIMIDRSDSEQFWKL